MGKVFRKAFSWVVEQDLHGNFRSMLYAFCLFFLVSLTELCCWYGLKDVFVLHNLAEKVVLDY